MDSLLRVPKIILNISYTHSYTLSKLSTEVEIALTVLIYARRSVIHIIQLSPYFVRRHKAIAMQNNFLAISASNQARHFSPRLRFCDVEDDLFFMQVLYFFQYSFNPFHDFCRVPSKESYHRLLANIPSVINDLS
jgi:hypothetical protein